MGCTLRSPAVVLSGVDVLELLPEACPKVLDSGLRRFVASGGLSGGAAWASAVHSLVANSLLGADLSPKAGSSEALAGLASIRLAGLDGLGGWKLTPRRCYVT